MARRWMRVRAGLATVALCSAAAHAEDVTTRLIPPLPGAPAGDGAALAAVPDLAWVTRDTGTSVEIWRTGGTPETTYLVTTVDVPSDPVLGRQFRLFASERGPVAWIEVRNASGHRLWWTDGTPGAISPVALADGDLDLRVSTPTPVGRDLFVLDADPATPFSARVLRCHADDPALARILPLPNAESIAVTSATVAGRQVHFERRGGSVVLVATDGKAGGTDDLAEGLPARVADDGSIGARFLGRGGERAAFVIDSGVGSPTLWTTDGTPAGTRPARLLEASPVTREVRAAATSRFAFGAIPWQPSEWTLAVTDGTATGTFLQTSPAALIACPAVEGFECTAAPFGLVADSRRGYFVADVGDAFGVWTTDGTPAGTRPLPRIAEPARGFSVAESIVPLDATDGALFVDSTTGPAVWYTSASQLSRRVAAPAPDLGGWIARPPRTVGRRLLVPTGDAASPSWSVALLDALAVRPGSIDTDHDDVADEVEEELGASAFDAAETPLGAPAGAPRGLVAQRVHGRADQGRVTVDVIARIRPPVTTRLGRAGLGRVAVSFGGVAAAFDVGNRGSASLPDGSRFRMRTHPARRGARDAIVTLRLVVEGGAARLVDEFHRTDDSTGAPTPHTGLAEADIALYAATATWRGRTAVSVTADSGGALTFFSPRRASR